MNMPNRKIFRGYDVRGIYPSQLNEEIAQTIGRAVGSFFARHNVSEIVVGRDNRTSSDSLAEALISGLSSSGCDVLDVGIALTPMIYFATWGLRHEAAINVTASHNPAEYNGFKVVFDKEIIVGDEILGLIDQGDFTQGMGEVKRGNFKEKYFEAILAGIKIEKPLKLLFDPGNGTATFFSQELYRRLGFEVLELHATSNGNYPNHPPDPQLVENYQDMAKLVVDNKADLGIALDGDADRLNFCDDLGNFASGDLLIALFVREVLRQNPGGKILVTALVSQGILDFIKNLGGESILWRVGHAPLKEKMQESGALFGGEESGHLYFADRYLGYDDALYASVRLCEIVSKSQKLLSDIVSEVLDEIPQYIATKEYRISCPDEMKFELVAKVGENLKKNFEVTDVDGVRFQMDGGWGIVRPSNTEPVLSIRAEGKTKEKLSEVQKIISENLRSFKPQVNLVWED